MKRTIKKIFCLLAFSVVTFTALADDGGAWLSVQVNKGWKSAYAFARFEHRSYENFSKTEAFFAAAGGGYKFTPWLNADVSYEYWNVYQTITLHKAVLCGNATLVREGLAVSVREKLEIAANPAASSVDFTLRSRLKAQYRIPNSHFAPYAMAEVFNWSSWIRSLYYAGTEISFGKHSVLDIFYLYHVPAGAEPVHTAGVGYFFNF